jgi:small-conductance mechanosensitive channel
MHWLAENWPHIVSPLVALLAGLIVTLWLRRRAYKALFRWAERTEWKGDDIMVAATKGPSILWCIIISAYLAVEVSTLSAVWKTRAGNGLWTLFIISLALSVINLASGFIAYYGDRYKASQRSIIISNNIVRVVIFISVVLGLLDVWGAPTGALLIVIGLAVLILALSLREALPNLFAGLQLNARGRIKVGDYIKLETGEEGYVKEMDWANTQIEALGGGIVSIPNRKIAQNTVVNYGRQLKKAREPFHFFGRAHLKELTGLKASNLGELVNILKTAPDSVVYYHTHNFIEEHHYLTPEPANDFSVWVSDALGDDVLGERLAAIDTFEFTSLTALRDRLVSIIEEDVSQEAQRANGHNHRDAPEGREFRFIKSISVIVPTHYVAHDLREFVEVLRILSLSSLYFHIFESRLRLGKGQNDFSAWLGSSLDEKELAQEVARLDPYNYTLEGLRSSLIQLIEKRIK